ncbi:MAG: NAD-binding protein [Actinobacteria bacterium]|nr:NAD-binding protein [Actinomycetota bacterium]
MKGKSVNVGWIGLGAMGLPMASVLTRGGYQVTAFDLDAAKVAQVVEAGALSMSLEQVATNADILFVMVATGSQLESVLFGADGAAKVMAPGSVVVITATVGVQVAVSCAERLSKLGIGLVDAPVSGGVARAEAGDLLFMVSGSSSDKAKAMPLINLMAREAADFGEIPGDAQKAKLVNQLLCGVHIAVAGEALAFAESLGLDANQCWSALRGGAATSFMFEDRGRRMVEGPQEIVRSALGLFVKDLGLVTAEAAAHSLGTPLASAALGLFAQGRDEGHEREDDSVVIEISRKQLPRT